MPAPTRVEIPKISNRRLGYLARRIRPVVCLTELPRGRWPEDLSRSYWLKMPKDLRQDNFLHQRSLNETPRLVQEGKCTTLHVPGSAGRVFHPTIAEVLAQLPSWYTDEESCVVAFATYLEQHEPLCDDSGHFHVATTVLLAKGSPINRAGKERTFYGT